MWEILDAIIAAGGDPLFVGGCVRDKLIHPDLQPKDVDVEVFDLSASQLITALKPLGSVSVVGESFGVIKLRKDGEEFDFTLPRRDNKTGRGHKGFEVEVDHTMTPEEAAKRRDFTINAIGQRPNGDLVDPFNGQEDLKNGILRHTSKHFAEDPLRVLRGFQFAARFDLNVDKDTAVLCASLKDEFDTLARERIWGEWFKWATKSTVPGKGLRFLQATCWLDLFPEIAALVGTQQDPQFHPEGDVFVHTCHVCDAAVKVADREGLEGEDRAVLLLAALTHDLGKPETTVFEDGHLRSPAHAHVGVEIAERFLRSIGCFERVIQRVLPLVQEHMVHCNKGLTNRSIRRLAVRLGEATIDELLLVIESDASGRPPIPPGLPEEAREIGEMAKSLELADDKPEPIIMGRHLLKKGWKPGPALGLVLKAAFEAQLDGEFEDLEGGLKWVKEHGDSL